MNDKHPRFVYFGTPKFAVDILEEMAQEGFFPDLIVTAPDKPKGRKLIVTPSEVKVWAQAHDIPILTPETLKDPMCFQSLIKTQSDMFIVAAYGKIIPENILNIPAQGTLNVHPSLLPKFRGASPIESAILSNDTKTGTTIIQLDTEMDHGPIVLQEVLDILPWPPKASVLTHALAILGGKLLVKILKQWPQIPQAINQDHGKATYTKKITKEDGLIDLSADPYENFKKIRAYDEWPGAYFFDEHKGKKIRLRITDAAYKDEKLVITRVIPEGKKEMPYDDYLRGRHPSARDS